MPNVTKDQKQPAQYKGDTRTYKGIPWAQEMHFAIDPCNRSTLLSSALELECNEHFQIDPCNRLQEYHLVCSMQPDILKTPPPLITAHALLATASFWSTTPFFTHEGSRIIFSTMPKLIFLPLQTHFEHVSVIEVPCLCTAAMPFQQLQKTVSLFAYSWILTFKHSM